MSSLLPRKETLGSREAADMARTRRHGYAPTGWDIAALAWVNPGPPRQRTLQSPSDSPWERI